MSEVDRPRSRLVRLAVPIAITLLLLSIAIKIRPDQFGVLMLGIGNFTGACALGYLADTALFAHFLPRLTMAMLQTGAKRDADDLPPVVIAARVLSRVLLVFVAAYALRA